MESHDLIPLLNPLDRHSLTSEGINRPPPPRNPIVPRNWLLNNFHGAFSSLVNGQRTCLFNLNQRDLYKVGTECLFSPCHHCPMLRIKSGVWPGIALSPSGLYHVAWMNTARGGGGGGGLVVGGWSVIICGGVGSHLFHFVMTCRPVLVPVPFRPEWLTMSEWTSVVNYYVH